MYVLNDNCDISASAINNPFVIMIEFDNILNTEVIITNKDYLFLS